MRAWSRRRGWIEIAVVVGATALGLVAARPPAAKLPGGLERWLIPALFLYAPIIAILITDRDFTAAGLSAPRLRRAGLDLAALAFIILPIFLAGWWALASWQLGARFAVHFPRSPLNLILEQTIAVALPEEVFFRGWLQGRLNQGLGRPIRVLGASFGPGLPIAAALFAAAHYLVRPEPTRLLVFFPGLMFGYFRESSGSVAGPIVAHAACNFCFLILQSWAVYP